MSNQEELATELGVTLRSVGNWERGGGVPRAREGAVRVVLGQHLGSDLESTGAGLHGYSDMPGWSIRSQSPYVLPVMLVVWATWALVKVAVFLGLILPVRVVVWAVRAISRAVSAKLAERQA